MVRDNVKKEIERCIEKLGLSQLTENDLRRVALIVDESQPLRQDLLYLQTNSSSPTAPVIGMRILENGESSDGPADPDDWPYQSVLEATCDGWRVIKFPDMALMLDESRQYGLGCEFILERYG